MKAQYHFETDRSLALMRLKLSGFFDDAAISRLLVARAAAHSELPGPPNSHLTLVDIREMKIQSQQMVESFRALLMDERYVARRLAFVVGSTLARMQLIRVLNSRRARIFTTETEAEAWLFAQDDAAAA